MQLMMKKILIVWFYKTIPHTWLCVFLTSKDCIYSRSKIQCDWGLWWSSWLYLFWHRGSSDSFDNLVMKHTSFFLHLRGIANFKLFFRFSVQPVWSSRTWNCRGGDFHFSSSDKWLFFNLADCSPCVQWIWCRVQNDGEGGREGLQCASCLEIPDR